MIRLTVEEDFRKIVNEKVGPDGYLKITRILFPDGNNTDLLRAIVEKKTKILFGKKILNCIARKAKQLLNFYKVCFITNYKKY